jgi:hypothetical protein
MALARLFTGLRELLIEESGLDTANSLIPVEDITTFHEYEARSQFAEFGESNVDSGLELKGILEKVYGDTIDGFKNIRIEGGKIVGNFYTTISPTLFKKFSFEASPQGIYFELLNANQINNSDVSFAEIGLQPLDIVDFSNSDLPMTSTKKRAVKHCPNSKTCFKSDGKTFYCIPRNSKCASERRQTESEKEARTVKPSAESASTLEKIIEKGSVTSSTTKADGKVTRARISKDKLAQLGEQLREHVSEGGEINISDLQKKFKYPASKYGNDPQNNPINRLLADMRAKGEISVNGTGDSISPSVVTKTSVKIGKATKTEDRNNMVEAELAAKVDIVSLRSQQNDLLDRMASAKTTDERKQIQGQLGEIRSAINAHNRDNSTNDQPARSADAIIQKSARVEIADATRDKPFGDVSAEDENKFYGSAVTVSPLSLKNGRVVEPGGKGSVIRVLNNGELVEVQHYGGQGTTRYQGDRVSVDRITQQDKQISDPQKEQKSGDNKPYLSVGDLAETYKAQGLSRTLAWGRYVRDTVLSPAVRSEDVDAGEFYKSFDSITHPQVNPKYPIRQTSTDIAESAKRTRKTNDKVDITPTVSKSETPTYGRDRTYAEIDEYNQHLEQVSKQLKARNGEVIIRSAVKGKDEPIEQKVPATIYGNTGLATTVTVIERTDGTTRKSYTLTHVASGQKIVDLDNEAQGRHIASMLLDNGLELHPDLATNTEELTQLKAVMIGSGMKAFSIGGLIIPKQLIPPDKWEGSDEAKSKKGIGDYSRDEFVRIMKRRGNSEKESQKMWDEHDKQIMLATQASAENTDSTQQNKTAKDGKIGQVSNTNDSKLKPNRLTDENLTSAISKLESDYPKLKEIDASTNRFDDLAEQVRDISVQTHKNYGLYYPDVNKDIVALIPRRGDIGRGWGIIGDGTYNQQREEFRKQFGRRKGMAHDLVNHDKATREIETKVQPLLAEMREISQKSRAIKRSVPADIFTDWALLKTYNDKDRDSGLTRADALESIGLEDALFTKYSSSLNPDAQSQSDRLQTKNEPSGMNALGMDGKTRKQRISKTEDLEVPALPQKSIDMMSNAIEIKDADKLDQMLHPDNRAWRKMFESAVGVKLPRTVKGTREALRNWIEDKGDKSAIRKEPVTSKDRRTLLDAPNSKSAIMASDDLKSAKKDLEDLAGYEKDEEYGDYINPKGRNTYIDDGMSVDDYNDAVLSARQTVKNSYAAVIPHSKIKGLQNDLLGGEPAAVVAMPGDNIEIWKTSKTKPNGPHLQDQDTGWYAYPELPTVPKNVDHDWIEDKFFDAVNAADPKNIMGDRSVALYRNSLEDKGTFPSIGSYRIKEAIRNANEDVSIHGKSLEPRRAYYQQLLKDVSATNKGTQAKQTTTGRNSTLQADSSGSKKKYTEGELISMSKVEPEYQRLVTPIRAKLIPQIEAHQAYKELKDTIERSIAKIFDGKNGKKTKEFLNLKDYTPDKYLTYLPLNTGTATGKKILGLQAKIRNDLNVPKEFSTKFKTNGIDWNKLILDRQNNER